MGQGVYPSGEPKGKAKAINP